MNKTNRQNAQDNDNKYVASPKPTNVFDDGYSYGMGRGAVAQAAPQTQSGYVPGANGQSANWQPPQTYQQPYLQMQQPMYQQPQQPQQPQKKKRGKGFWIAIIIAIICLIVAGVLAYTLFNQDTPTRRQGDLGQLEGKTQEEIQAELDRVVEEGMFNISIASVVQFPSGDSEGELRIENVPGNRYLMQVVITRDDTGERIYETSLIEPNHHIQADTLDVVLPQGDYECTATFHAFDPETEEPIGQAAAKITISVLS